MITLLNIELAALEKSIDILNDNESIINHDSFENSLSFFDLFISLKKLHYTVDELKFFFNPILKGEKTRIYSGWDKTPIIRFNETRNDFRDHLSKFFSCLYYFDKYLYHMFNKHEFDFSYGKVTFKSIYFKKAADEILIEKSIVINENETDMIYISDIIQKKYDHIKAIYHIEKGFSEPDDFMMFHEDDILHNQTDLLIIEKRVIQLEDLEKIKQLYIRIGELENCIMNTLSKFSNYLIRTKFIDNLIRLD